MSKKFFLAISICLAAKISSVAQTEPKIAMNLLANDKIAEVNINQDKYIETVRGVIDLMKKEFKDIPEEQKIVLLIVSHKAGNPTIEFYSNPELKQEVRQHFLKELNALHFENTKLVDFPILLNINVKDGNFATDFKELVLPADRVKNEYKNADIKKKYELNKSWAINEVLPVLSAYQTIVDEKFVGVRSFGSLISKTNFSESQNLTDITSRNQYYWRATVEMSVGNQLIPTTKIFAHVAQGELDYALTYLEMVNMFSDPKSIPSSYLSELNWRMELFNKQLNAEIEKGIAEHDKGNYQAAIDVYNTILTSYPNSAWTLYEKYYSQNALDLENKKIKLEDRTSWDKAKVGIYKCNPLYHLDVKASNGKEGYLLFRRQEMSTLFKSKDEKLNDVYKYADIAMDLRVYDFAAQLFWYSFTFSKNKENDKALNKFLYCIEQLGVSNLKENFKGNFEKEFKKIETEKEKEMTSSSMYKAFKK
jgi:hypothetical protein